MHIATLACIALLDGPPHRSPAEPAPVELAAILPSESGRRLPWSPKGRAVDWVTEPEEAWRRRFEEVGGTLIDPLFAAIDLGTANTPPVHAVLCRTEPGAAHRERLIIDADRDGRIDPQREQFTGEVDTRPDRTWVRFASVVMEIPAADGAIAHEFSIWYSVRAAEPDTAAPPPRLFLTTRSWMEGVVTLDGAAYRIALIEFDNDGQYTRADRWVIVPDGPDAERAIGEVEPLAPPIRPCFVGEQAFRLGDVAPSARAATVRMNDDLKRRPEGPYEARLIAEVEPSWHGDLDEAMRRAAADARPLLVTWTAAWSGQCRVLERGPLRDAAVAGVLHEWYVCARIDRDAAIDAAARHGVESLPTMIIFDAAGREAARQTGPISTAALEAWLSRHAAGH